MILKITNREHSPQRKEILSTAMAIQALASVSNSDDYERALEAVLRHFAIRLLRSHYTAEDFI